MVECLGLGVLPPGPAVIGVEMLFHFDFCRLYFQEPRSFW